MDWPAGILAQEEISWAGWGLLGRAVIFLEVPVSVGCTAEICSSVAGPGALPTTLARSQDLCPSWLCVCNAICCGAFQLWNTGSVRPDFHHEGKAPLPLPPFPNWGNPHPHTWVKV